MVALGFLPLSDPYVFHAEAKQSNLETQGVISGEIAQAIRDEGKLQAPPKTASPNRLSSYIVLQSVYWHVLTPRHANNIVSQTI